MPTTHIFEAYAGSHHEVKLKHFDSSGSTAAAPGHLLHFSPANGLLERLQNCTVDNGKQNGSEVGSDSTERQSKVHALAEDRVQPTTDISRQVCLQRVEKVPDLGGGVSDVNTITVMSLLGYTVGFC